MTAAHNRCIMMDFSFPEHCTTGVLNADDLKFFYYDIGLDNLQKWPDVYDWDSVISEFHELNVEVHESFIKENDKELILNKIKFYVYKPKNSPKKGESTAAAFFRHLRNAFAHYHIAREGENLVIFDKRGKRTTMIGLVNAELLKQFCFRFFDMRENIINNLEGSYSSTAETTKS